ncbi:multidrug transporter [Rickettsia sp. R2]|nr:multidrug transporter [Rickettsia parkeri]
MLLFHEIATQPTAARNDDLVSRTGMIFLEQYL